MRVEQSSKVSLTLGMTLVAFALLQVVALPAFALRLSPAMQPGERYDLVLSLEENVSTTIEAKGEEMLLREGKARMAIAGVFEVLEVDRWQRPIRRRLDIQRFSVGLIGEEVEVLPPGTSVLISQSTEASAAIRADGLPLASQAARALETLFDAWSAVGVDEMFAIADPAEPGKRWPVLPEKALEALGLESGEVVDPEAIEGEVRILGPGEVGGEPCVSSRLDLSFPMRDPSGQMPEDVDMRIALERDDCTPEDGAAAPRSQDERYVTTLRVPSPTGGAQVTRQERRLKRELRQPAKAAAKLEYL